MFSLFTAVKPEYHLLAAYIRIGHKYRINYLVSQCMAYLKNHFTNDFDIARNLPTYCPANMNDVEAIGVINLARLIGEVSLIPHAILTCCTVLTGEQIVRGFEDKEHGIREVLSDEDLDLCYKATQRLIATNLRITFRLYPFEPAPNCRSRLACKMRSSRDAMSEQSLDHMATCDPFSARIPDSLLCAECQKLFKERDREERRKEWLKLPSTLGIEVEGWPTQ